MKQLNKTQYDNLKTFWDGEYKSCLAKKDSPVRVYFTPKTMEWLTWEEEWHRHPELNNPDKYFYFDTGDPWMRFVDLYNLAAVYLNTGAVGDFYD